MSCVVRSETVTGDGDGERWGPGRVIADRYELREIIGRGGMGTVWRAEHTRLRSPVAVKLLGDDIASQPDGGPRFLREAQACAAIRGPNIVQILDFGVEDGTPYIAMELLEGETLRARLERRSTLDAEETLTIIGQIAKAVGRAHRQGIVHRDLKPGNIQVCNVEGEDEEIVKVLDFGIAKVMEGTRLGKAQLTATGQMLGTMAYMSPEQVRGRVDLDHRADLWALGIITYQCLVGSLPYGEDANPVDLMVQICSEPMPVPSAVAPSLPSAFDAWFARATKRGPDDRFQTTTDMVDELARIVESGRAR